MHFVRFVDNSFNATKGARLIKFVAMDQH